MQQNSKKVYFLFYFYISIDQMEGRALVLTSYELLYIQQTGSTRRFLIQFGKVDAVGRRSIDFRTEWCNFGCKVNGRILASYHPVLGRTCLGPANIESYRHIGCHSLGYD